MVSRSDLPTRLRRRTDEALRGSGALVVVTGEPGRSYCCSTTCGYCTS